MELVSKNYEVFTFDELNNSAKEVVKLWYLEGQESSIFTDSVVEDLNITWGVDLSVEYSLGYCQGDGLCLSGSVDILTDIIDNPKMQFLISDFTDVEKEDLEKILEETSKIELTHRGNYYHKYSIIIDYCSDYGYPEVAQDATADKVLERFKDWYMERCNEYEKQGYEYFYEIDEDYLSEVCEANEYRFLANGKIFPK